VLEVDFLRAVVFRGVRNFKVEDVPEPRPSVGEALVEFRAGSICGTDLHFYRGEWTRVRDGQIIGHDAWGVKTDTGERVGMIPIIHCGSCYYCLRGMPNLCVNGRTKGFDEDGFLAEFVAMPSANLLPIPDGVSDDEAAVLEPVALAIHTLGLLQPSLGDWVTVVGQGAVGLLMTQVAKLKGCRVIAVDLHDYRLRLSEKFGADVCIDAKKEDAVERVREITQRGSDVVIEAAGTKRTVEQTPRLVRKAGKVALIGEMEGHLDMGDAPEALFFAGYLSPNEYPLALELIKQREVDVKSLITHRFKLADFEQAIKTADDFSQKPGKVIITA
jgi:threonine dehydrogenase-like Zn-dependent dehydrogenase